MTTPAPNITGEKWMIYTPVSAELWYFATSFMLGALGSLLVQTRKGQESTFPVLLASSGYNGILALAIVFVSWHLFGSEYPLILLSFAIFIGIANEADKEKMVGMLRDILMKVLEVVRNFVLRKNGGNGGQS